MHWRTDSKATSSSLICISVLSLFNPFRTAVPFRGQTTWNWSGLSPHWDCSTKGVKTVVFLLRDRTENGINPFKIAVSFWGQTTQIVSSLSPNGTAVLPVHDCCPVSGATCLEFECSTLLGLLFRFGGKLLGILSGSSSKRECRPVPNCSPVARTKHSNSK